MLRLVTIDLSDADMAMFERYGSEVPSMVPKYGGRLEMRVRALDGRTETDLLYFSDRERIDIVLDAASPRAIVVNAFTGRPYGHPSPRCPHP